MREERYYRDRLLDSFQVSSINEVIPPVLKLEISASYKLYIAVHSVIFGCHGYNFVTV